MLKPETNVMALVDACRSPLRRKIMILAEETKGRGETTCAKKLADALEANLSNLSYHVKILAEAGALEEVGGEPKRGAWQKNYVPSKAFQATMTDTVALDQIAEWLDARGPSTKPVLAPLARIVRATGRPVEA